MDVNLPHALATLTRDVLQNYRPVWWGHCDLGSYRLEGEPLYGVDKGPLVTLRFIHQQEERRRTFERYIRKLDETMRLYCDDPTERLRGPRGPDPFSVVLTREELQQLYPDPVRCVGEDGSVVYARVHFEHPSYIVKGKLKE